ncbi:MAG TPA: transglycosylase SLT domain-containing protein [Smithella sp.]|nr:transglycosylase SLT domain-containing protein [Smithella sp.]
MNHKRWFSPSTLIVVFTVLMCGCLAGPAPAQLNNSHVQSLIEATRISGPLSFGGEAVPLNETDVKERLERELLIILNDSDTVILWLKRANRYFPYLESALRTRALPDDLKYLVIAESSLKPTALSSKGAAGFWQFMESTAKKYQLQVNSAVDERRHFLLATDAALKYLKDLFSLFGSWTLAAAAYNMGEEALKTEMLLQKESNYYHLFLNEETQRYVFRILAAKMILSNPEKYGYRLTGSDLYEPLSYDIVEITADQPVPIYVIAKAANTYFKVIKDLNPHIKNYSLPAGKHALMIPGGSSKWFYERFQALYRKWLDDKQNSVYTVQRGDNLSAIAQRFNVSAKAIMVWNNITNPNSLSPGDKIFIFSDPETLKSNTAPPR